jgi:hypothetical protein
MVEENGGGGKLHPQFSSNFPLTDTAAIEIGALTVD